MALETILIIEDNPLNNKLFRTVLELDGFVVITAFDAEDGLLLARERRPDIILMDIQLPGMDGLEATKVIKEDPQLKNIPVIALTAHAMEGDDSKAYAVGCCGYITKPVKIKTFAQSIRSHLDNEAPIAEQKKSASKSTSESASKSTSESASKSTSESASKSTSESASKTVDYTVSIVQQNPDIGSYQKTILIVDDELLNLQMLEAMLSCHAYKVKTVTGGTEALSVIQAQAPDLVLLDIMMPDIDGYEVCKRLKNNPETKDIPIILITALRDYDCKIKGLEAGADEFLNKPIQTEELLTRVQSLLRMKEYHERLSNKLITEKNFICKTKLGNENEKKGIVLLIEDSPADRLLVETNLAGEPFRLLTASDGREALEIVDKEHVDCLLVDIMLPDMDGFEVCRRIKEIEAYRHIQTIGITGSDDLSLKMRGIEAGFDDYLFKPVNFTELKIRIKALLKKKFYLDQLQNKYHAVFQQAITDSLTGLYNNAYCKHFLDIDIEKAKRQGYPIALIMADLDNFKRVNDIHGHISGDVVLQEVAKTLAKTIRVTDVAARYGGEEFVMILPYTETENAKLLAERIIEAVRTCSIKIQQGKLELKVTISLGIAIYPDHATTRTELFEHADQALYISKRQGKDRWTLYPDIGKQGNIIFD